jgi:hypothetical protein
LAQFLFDAKIRELQTTEDHSAAAHVRVAQRVIPDLRLLPISPDQGKEYLRHCRPDLYLQRYGEDPGKEFKFHKEQAVGFPNWVCKRTHFWGVPDGKQATPGI